MLINDDANSLFYAGLDIGTSGCRIAVIRANGGNSTKGHSHAQDVELVYEDHIEWPDPATDNGQCIQQPELWWNGLEQLLSNLALSAISRDITALLVDATSSTVLVTDLDGDSLEPALMYSDSSCLDQAEIINRYAPDNSPARGPGSSLAKWLYFYQQYSDKINSKKCRIVHQADWVIGKLCGNHLHSDEHNCLKLGFDNVQQCWPQWLLQMLNENCPVPIANPNPTHMSSNTPDSLYKHYLLPKVLEPGQLVGTIQAQFIKRFKLNPSLKILAGTTDSTASFIASGANKAGDAVTSLGSTLVLKILATKPIFASQYGIYSHRLGDLWLTGGASNSGGAALKQFFTPQQMQTMETQLAPAITTNLQYYPLPGIGERFPTSDPNKESNTEPRPDNDVLFFQALLEGITRIEKSGYDKLQELGAPKVNRILTTGGGAKNLAWLEIRKRMLNLPIAVADHQQAAYGAALLALK